MPSPSTYAAPPDSPAMFDWKRVSLITTPEPVIKIAPPFTSAVFLSKSTCVIVVSADSLPTNIAPP